MSPLSPFSLIGWILLLHLAPARITSSSPSVSNYLRPPLQLNHSIGIQNLTTLNFSTSAGAGALFTSMLNVPGTSTILYFSYGWGLRRALSPRFVQSLIVTTQDYLWDQIAQHGVAAIYPYTPNYHQDFFRSLGDGVYLEIENWGPERLMSWGDLEEVVEGLSIWFFRMHKFKQVYFSFDDDYGRLGRGKVALGGGTVATDVVDSVG